MSFSWSNFFYHYEKVNQITYLSSRKCPNFPLCAFSLLQVAKPLLAPAAECKITGSEYAEILYESLGDPAIKLNLSHTTTSTFSFPSTVSRPICPQFQSHPSASSQVLLCCGFQGGIISDDLAQRGACPCVNTGFCPGPRALLLQGGQLPLGESFKPQESEHGHAVLLGHDVVENGVDGGAEVEEHKGHQVAVLADLGDLQGAGLEGLGEEVPPHVEGQPAEDERQHHHS